MSLYTPNTITEYIDSLNLSFFTGDEILPLWYRITKGVQNSEPPKDLWKNIGRVLTVVDEIRRELNYPVKINSLYRNSPYNTAVDSNERSQHRLGKAADFRGIRETSKQWAAMAQSMRGRVFTTTDGQTFTLVGGIGVYRTFVHIDVRPTEANWRNY